MALNIRNRDAEKLAADLAALTGENKTDAVINALKDRLSVVRQQKRKRHVLDRLNEIAKHCASLPVLDKRNPDDLLYDEQGLPH